ncbi:hypothetical protein I5G81_gp94 [Mycobacterium phage Shandong1]|uniref:Uncharacterized protein n=1 Tax=Mycobacterium phage Shandong1 TaxID=1983447 RepID=A0A1X9SHC1_9CAUD|nr:hypothetical protein I5G81_gp94 [Mycobacterium phage Shandong1]ARQ95533.1 hypothetical protein [Mycobacterium phage Shandong1]
MLNMTYPMTCDKGTINGKPVPAFYMGEADHARHAAELTGHDVSLYRTLLAAIRTGLPVVITHRERDGRRRKTTAIVEWAVVTDARNARLRVAYWGFAHHLYLSDIEAIDTPDVEYLD